MTAVVAPQIAIEIIDKVEAAPNQEPQTLDRIAADHGLTLPELRALLARRRTPVVRRPTPPVDEQPDQPMKKACSKCAEVKPLTEYFPNKNTKDGRASWCRKCNNDRPRTPARMVEGRARGRAYRLLAKAHPVEFEQIFAAETQKAIAEHERVAQEAQARGQADAAVARIKPGPKRREQSDAIERLDVARCPKCHRYHDAGHQANGATQDCDTTLQQQDGAA